MNKELKNASNFEIAKEVLERRKYVINECIDIINKQLFILDGFGIKVYDEEKSFVLNEIKNIDNVECEMEIEYL